MRQKMIGEEKKSERNQRKAIERETEEKRKSERERERAFSTSSYSG